MRGKEFDAYTILNRCRITPAYAGKSGARLGLGQQARGSPPPMRGKAVISVNRFMVIGITPAYAGKSQSVGY